MAGCYSTKMHQNLGWLLGVSLNQDHAQLTLDFSLTHSPLTVGYWLQICAQNLPKIWFENTSEKPTSLALKPLWFSKIFFTLTHT